MNKMGQETVQKEIKNKYFEMLGIQNYYKDPENPNFFYVDNYCKHNQKLHIGYTQLVRFTKQGRGTLCKECNIEIYESYEPSQEEIDNFKIEFEQFIEGKNGLTKDAWIFYYPRELKIIDVLCEVNAFDKNSSIVEKLNFLSEIILNKSYIIKEKKNKTEQIVKAGFNTMQEIYDKADGDSKAIMLYMRKPENVEILLNETSGLVRNDITISERYYCWKNNIETLPLCPYCGQPKKWYDQKKGYQETCGSEECKSKARQKKAKEQETKEQKDDIFSISELWEKVGHDKKALFMSMQDQKMKDLLLTETSSLHNDADIAERLYCAVNGLTSAPVCPVCGKPRKYKKGKYQKTCGDKECFSKLISDGNINAVQFRDYDAQVKKGKQTYKDRTGYEHNMQNPEAKKAYFEEYAKKHNGEKCGVCSQKAKDNRKATFDREYDGNIWNALYAGAVRMYGSLSEKAKRINYNIGEARREKANEELLRRIQEMGYTVVKFVSENILTLKCNRCSSEFDISRQSINVHYRNNDFKFCHKCDYKEMTFRSKFEEDVLDYIKSIYDGDIETNVKYRFDGMECDIFLPKLNIGIEANGVYWHTEQYKEKNSHIEKKKKLHEKGCSLIQIWDDDWNDAVKREIILSRLAEKIGVNSKIYARKCEYVEDIDTKTVKKFLEDNHLHGYVPSKYRIGLYYEGVLVMVMTVGKRRRLIGQNDDSLELLRLCTLKGISVVGGFSKLLSHFRKSHIGERMISYADCDWCDFDSNGYSSVGFEFVRQTVLDYYWCHREIRENRMNYTKQKLVAAGYDSSKTEVEIMHDLGYFRLYGSGNFLYEIIL